MKWTDDVERGSWLRERITGEGGFPAVAGTGWDAYARILHPVEAFGYVDGEFVTFEWTWAEATRRRGLAMNALIDWNAVGRQAGQIQIDGLTLSSGQEGRLEPRLLGHLASVLRAETSTPHDITIGVWAGFGKEADPESIVSLADGETGEESLPAPTDTELDALLSRLADEAIARLRAGILPSPPEGPLLELPGRDYYVAAATLQDLENLAEHDDDLANGLQLIWPADHKWLVASEIDFDSTIVAGSHDLIRHVIDHPGLEAFEVVEDDLFDFGAHTAG